ncbi:MAG: glycosyltransferase family 1 protein [bacterium]
MKIALDCRRIQPGMSGLGTYTLQIMTALADQIQQGKDELTVFITPESRRAAAIPTDRVNCIGVPWPVENHLAGDYWKHITLPRLLDRSSVDVFHDPSYQLPLKRSRAAYVVTIHDLAPFRFPETNTLKYNLYWKFMTRSAVKRADRIIAVSEFTRKDIIDLFPTSENRIDVVPEAAAACFVPGEPTVERLESLGVRKPYFLTAAKYEPRKNLERCVRAFMLGPARFHPDIKLVIAGAMGWKNKNLERYLQEKGVQDRVVLTGYLERSVLVEIIQGAEAVLVPSIYEGFGLPVLESMACGTPVICSDAGSLPEIGADAALYFDPYDIESMATVMNKFLFDSEMQIDLRRQALERAVEFSWTQAARATLGVYRHALDK